MSNQHRRRCLSVISVAFVSFAVVLASRSPLDAQQPSGTVAIVGATVIDGNGGAPLPNATVVVTDKRMPRSGRAARSPCRLAPPSSTAPASS